MKNNEWHIIKEMIKEKVSVADWAFLSNDAMVYMDDFDGNNVVILTANSFVSNVLDKPDIIRAIKETADRYYGKCVSVSIREATVEEFDKITKRNKKPRMCEILGVEVGGRFRVKIPRGTEETCYVDGNGVIRLYDTGGTACKDTIFCAINHPDRIIKNKLTDKEQKICELIGAKWVSLDKRGSEEVDLWEEKPVSCGDVYEAKEGVYILLSRVSRKVFRSVNPGDCIYVG